MLDMDTLESERKGFYLAGVIVAGTHTNEIFIENGRFHGKLIAEAISKELGAAEQTVLTGAADRRADRH
jgi:thioredoxin reductase (NADPH)